MPDDRARNLSPRGEMLRVMEIDQLHTGPPLLIHAPQVYRSPVNEIAASGGLNRCSDIDPTSFAIGPTRRIYDEYEINTTTDPEETEKMSIVADIELDLYVYFCIFFFCLFSEFVRIKV